MKVKICGIKCIEDALMAIELGADAIGLLVGQKHTSPDFIDADVAKNIISQLPPYCSSVLVTVFNEVKEIMKLAAYIGVSTIQLQGDSTPEDIIQIRKQLPYIKLIKSLHVIDKASIEKGKKYLSCVDAILLDTLNISTNQIGGTGLTHDWDLSRKIVTTYDVPVILAGGLNPDNVKDAILKVQPYAVDVNSGVKDSDGYKDFGKLRNFIYIAKGFE